MADVNLDISKYIEEQYIFLKAKNFDKYGKSKNAAAVFNQRYEETKNKIKSDMLTKDIVANQKMASIVKNLGEAKAAQELHNLVANGNLLELCLEDVVEGINAVMVPEAQKLGIQDIVESAYRDFSNLLENGVPEIKKLQDFFTLIIEGLNKLQGSVSQNFLNELSRIEGNFLNNAGNIAIVEEKDLTNAEFLIRKYLYSAAEKLNTSKDKKVAANVFRGTLSNIFNTAICERISQKLLSKGITKGLKDIEDTLLNHRFDGRSEGVTVTAQISQGSKNSGTFDELTTGLGQAVAGEDKHKSKVDLAGPGPLEITIQEAGQSVTIEMELNASAKQVLTVGKGARNPSNLKGNIHIVSSSLGAVLNKISSNEVSYYSYNTVVHRDNGMKDGAKAYRSFRNFITASFFVEWLIGTGEQLQVGGTKIGVTDTAQFFLINNKLYSMATIIRNICDKIVNTKRNPPISIEIRGKAVNNKIGSVDDIKIARERSDALRQALNTVTIGATLSRSVINQYAPL